MAKAKKKATKRTTARKKISLKKTVADLEAVTKQLGKVRDRATGKEKEELDLKVKALEAVHKQLTEECKTFVLWPVPPKGS